MSLSAYEARHGGKPDALAGSDAAGLRDLAYRSLRVARTARRAADEKQNVDAAEMLLTLAGHAEETADSANALADWLEHAGHAAATPAGDTDA